MEEIKAEINQKREICHRLIDYIDKEDANEEDFRSLINFINHQKIREDKSELFQFLYIVSKISKHHQRSHGFIDKIKKIIFDFKMDIKKNFTEDKILHLFKSDKLILLYLIKEELITVTPTISLFLYDRHSNFFYPEIKPFLSDENISKIESQISEYKENFEELRQIGENPSCICELIRNDSIDEFVVYMNKYDISASSCIKRSFFETHLHLDKDDVSLIEYAAYFGAIQIFQYLMSKNAEITGDVWMYSIEGRSAEIINQIENSNIEPIDLTYEGCYAEAIKCFHNDIADYIHDNYLCDDYKLCIYIQTKIGKSDNYLYYPTDDIDYHSFLLCHNDRLVDICKKSYMYPDGYSIVANAICGSEFNYYPDLKKKKIQLLTEFIEGGNDDNHQVKIISPVVNTNEFYRHNDLEFAFISSRVASIRNDAFCLCTSLKLVTFESPSSLREIRSFTFNKCQSLKAINIPSSVSTIRMDAFNLCSSLSHITFDSPSSLTTITRELFKQLPLNQIKIPSSVKIIGIESFALCSKLMVVEFESNSSLKLINKMAFFCASSLVQIKLPASLNKICDKAFFSCSSLREIVFESPSSLSSIASHAFAFCKALKEITLPSYLQKIGPGAFKDCYGLQNVFFENISCLDTIGDQAFENCSSLQKISIPLRVRIIGYHAFDKCNSLALVEMNNCLKPKSDFPSHTKVIRKDANEF